MFDREGSAFDSCGGDTASVPAAGIVAPADEEHALLRRYVETGSEEAFTQLVLRHSRWIHGICRRALRDAHLAEDATQAVFLLLSRKAPTFSPEMPLGPWLYQSCRYVLADLRKNRARYQRRQEIARDAALRRMIAASSGPDEPPAEVLAALDEAVSRLDERDRAVVLMHFYEGLTLRQMAERLELTRDGAKKRVSRVLARLRATLASKGFLKRAAPLTLLVACLRSQAAQPLPPHLIPLLTQAATVPGAASVTAQSIASAVAATLARGTTRLLLALAVSATPLIMVGAAFQVLRDAPKVSQVGQSASAVVAAQTEAPATAPVADLSVLAANPSARPRGAELVDIMPESTGDESPARKEQPAEVADTLEKHRLLAEPVAAPVKAAVAAEEATGAPAGGAPAGGGGGGAAGGIVPILVYAPAPRPQQAATPFRPQATSHVSGHKDEVDKEAARVEKPETPVDHDPKPAREARSRKAIAVAPQPATPGVLPVAAGHVPLAEDADQFAGQSVTILSSRPFDIDPGVTLADAIERFAQERGPFHFPSPEFGSGLAWIADGDWPHLHPFRDAVEAARFELGDLAELVRGERMPHLSDTVRGFGRALRHDENGDRAILAAPAAQAPEPALLLPACGAAALLLRPRNRRR